MKMIAMLLVLLVATPLPSSAQGIAERDIWRGLAGKLDPGTTVKLRLVSGQRFKATLLQVSDEAITVQVKTRVPLAPQLVRFDDISSLEVDNGKGANLARAVAIGAATGAGAFFAFMALAFAVWGD